MMFDDVRFNTEVFQNMGTPNLDAPSLAHGQSLSEAALHDISMLYLHKTAYDGILPEQLALEYLLAKSRISEFMLANNETKKTDTPDGSVRGHKLEDSIPKT